MHVGRLRHEIVVLRRVKAEKHLFNLSGASWTRGTVCCAIGYGALDPEFQTQGLKLTLFASAYGARFEPASIEEL